MINSSQCYWAIPCDHKFKIKMLLMLLAICFLIILLLFIIKCDDKENNKMNGLELMAQGIEKEFSKIMNLDQDINEQIKVLQHQIQG